MSKEAKTAVLMPDLDVKQEVDIAELVNRSEVDYSIVMKNVSNMNQNDSHLTSMESNITTIGTTNTSNTSRISDAITNVSNLSVVTPDFENLNYLTINRINTGLSSGYVNYIVDLNAYLTAKSGDVEEFILASTSLISTSTRYYIEVEGELVANDDLEITESTVNLDSTTLVKLYDWRREYSGSNQVGGALELTENINKENFQLTYGAGHYESTSGITNDHLAHMKIDSTDVGGETLYFRGSQFRYIATLTTRASLTSESEGTTYRHGYGIWFNGVNTGLEYRNVKIRVINLDN